MAAGQCVTGHCALVDLGSGYTTLNNLFKTLRINPRLIRRTVVHALIYDNKCMYAIYNGIKEVGR